MSAYQDKCVYWFSNEDPQMQQAYKKAGATFRFLWRELSWERRRIVPALNLACVKMVFADRPLAECGPSDPIEQMWLGDINFDGRTITGKLLNEPNRLESVKQGDACVFPFEQLTDWMYAISRRVYGAYTVNLMRSRMKPAESQAHDAAWGLDFGDPTRVLLTASGQPDDSAVEIEHPMSVNMGPSLVKHLQENPGTINQSDNRGWTFLHNESLAGNSLVVDILLKHGADRSLRTRDGDLAIDLARRMRWEKVIGLLSA